ncbi:MAG: 16S rRNA (adenine(1518)-N(6)/adenine(1519)-N(6))-dimethyltransferase RsmA [Lentisphaeria bacterium]|nr:16S rRNA (adenine(1518)-N(6)/adenine(1519)-N(6))-dimethyltransferase RsmA [Lentisphaeria bacterium]
MKFSDLKNVLQQIGVQPSKKLGQNFLVDQNITRAIISDVEDRLHEPVLEIGPGTGALTALLLEKNTQLTAIEFDHRLAEYIRTTYGDNPNFRLIEGDAARIDFEPLFDANQNWHCIANLPYGVSSIVVAKLAELPNPPLSIMIMVQKEMADRMLAGPDVKNYGALSVRIQAAYSGKQVRKVPPSVFHPPPDVMSSIIELKRVETMPELGVRLKLKEVAQCAFSQRRKRAMRLLSSRFKADQVEAAFTAMSLDSNARAEHFTVSQFCELTQRLCFD